VLQPGSLGDTLLRHSGPWPLTTTIQHSKRVPLEGVELEEWERGRAGDMGVDEEKESVQGVCVCACVCVYGVC
jgi:hypothetical protein